MEKRRGTWMWVITLCAAWILGMPLLEAFRGVDLTDTGFLLSNQYWMLHEPAAVPYWFHLYLPNLLGGLLLWVTGPWGLFVAKLAAAVLFWGLVWAVFRLYGKEVPAHWLWVGAAVMLAFDFAGKINVVHYNNLSALFYGWGVVFIVEGVMRHRPHLFFWAGVVLAANTLVRLPNVLGVVLIVVPYVTAFLSRRRSESPRLGWRPFAAFAAGAAAVAVASVGVMALLGHLNLYLDSLRSLTAESSAGSGTHYGLRKMIGRPIKSTLAALAGGLGAGVSLALLGWLLSKIRPRAVWLTVAAAVGISIGFAAGVFFRDLRLVALPIAGLIYLTAVAVFFRRGEPSNSRTALATILSAFTVFLLNWGSDTGIAVSTYVFPLALPGLLLAASTVSWRWIKPARLILLAALAGYSAFILGTNVYRDVPVGTVWPSVEGIGPVLTSPDRAHGIDSLVKEIKKRTHPGDEVLIADSLPLLHYLTATKPYLGNPWPALYTPLDLAAELASREKKSLPVLTVVAKANARNAKWPLNKGTPVVGAESLRNFLDRNSFVLVAETEEALFYSRQKDQP